MKPRRNCRRQASILTVFSSMLLIISLMSCNAFEIQELELDKLNNQLKNNYSKDDEYFFVLNKRYRKSKDLFKWEAQLRKIVENDSLLRSCNLTLVDYVFDGDVKDVYELDKIKSDIAEHTFVEKNNSGNNIDDLAIDDYRIFLDHLLPTSDLQLSLVPKQSNSNSFSPIYTFQEKDLEPV